MEGLSGPPSSDWAGLNLVQGQPDLCSLLPALGLVEPLAWYLGLGFPWPASNTAGRPSLGGLLLVGRPTHLRKSGIWAAEASISKFQV